ncbi:DUF2282 domain-containing protein [Candidatus Berkiella cookevillensis]|uniref:DUF2282 domain-containing protein n=1 Tax=Candidatus Berkiella cookevillensis TaxID=437022 RepID=A0A0Q9YAQ2_9GAMM|nr:DUF2282 domain-containing protein [Candidatus Berkiella cookevillensis]MCS5709528.1 DUF2282 domain-containing protein [Candidatus Berkiella cookevillensis]
MRNKISKIVTAAIVGVVGVGVFSVSELAQAKKGDVEKCYGVAKAGKNDCGTSIHACAGQSTQDQDPNEWIYLPKGTCDKISGGKTK